VSGVRSSAAALALGAVLGIALAGCQEQGTPMTEGERPEPTLPTRLPTSGPPSTPTDSFAKVRVVGTVVAVADDGTCVDVEDANGVLWSLLGPGVEALDEGDRVSATGQALPESGTCAGAAVRVLNLATEG
jgi:hypothetical protein